MQLEQPALAQAVAVPFLKLWGVVIGGCLMARAASVAGKALAANGNDDFYRSKLVTCRFYAEQVLPEAFGLARVVKNGAGSVVGASPELI